MLRVQLKRSWFGPNSHLYERSQSRYDLREIPTEFEAKLPKDAVVIKRDDEPAQQPLQTKSSLDAKFDKAAHDREVVDQGLANAMAVHEAQSARVPDRAAGLINDGSTEGRAEVAATAKAQNEGPVKDAELEAALARRAAKK